MYFFFFLSFVDRQKAAFRRHVDTPLDQERDEMIANAPGEHGNYLRGLRDYRKRAGIGRGSQSSGQQGSQRQSQQQARRGSINDALL